MGTDTDERVRVRFTGRVQGVGFRVTTFELAKGFDVVGNVRNMGDGSVALVAEGAPAELQKFLQAILTRFERNIVTAEDHWESLASRNFTGFSIAETSWN